MNNPFPLNWIKCIVFGAKSLHSNEESPSPVGQPKRIRVFLGIADHQQCSAQQPLGLSVLVYNNIGNSDVMIRQARMVTANWGKADGAGCGQCIAFQGITEWASRLNDSP